MGGYRPGSGREHPDAVSISSVVRPDRIGYVGPNWFASVMGTGIVATAGATLPRRVPGLHDLTIAVWLVAVTLLAGVTVATVRHWLRHPDVARNHGRDVGMAPFYGAPPMALLTVGTGALLVGKDLIGLRAAVDLDWVLWALGTVLGLLSAVVIPYRLFTALDVGPDAAFGGWLMPVVPPMVSAASGALLVPHLATVSGRATLLYGCYAMFGMSLVASVIIITLIWSRLAHHGSSNAAQVPTLWIVLGPLGQSITAAGLLGADAHLAVSHQLAAAMAAFAVLFGVPIWGFALLWAALAGALTASAVRRSLPFALTWWSFTFPVGTMVTGTTRLAVETGLPAFRWAAILAYGALLSRVADRGRAHHRGVRPGRCVSHPDGRRRHRTGPEGLPRGRGRGVAALDRVESVVGGDKGAIDAHRVRGAEVRGQGRDLLGGGRGPDPSHRRHGQAVHDPLRGRALGVGRQAGVHPRRADGVAAYAPMTVERGDVAGQADQRVLRRGVGGASDPTGEPGDGRNVDDGARTRRRHRGQHGAAQAHRRGDVDRQDQVPQVVGGVLHRREAVEQPGHIGQDVHRSARGGDEA